MKALIIVDLQYDFLPGGSLPVADGHHIIPLINELQKRYELIVATQDWHPADHLSFATQHQGSSAFSVSTLDGLPQVLWPDHCIQGTHGAALVGTLDTSSVAAIFRKGMDRSVDSYSAFFDNGRRQTTGLTGYLKEKMVTEVDVCGLAADYCVFFTAMDSLSAGFKTTILLEATRPIDAKEFLDKQALFLSAGGMIR